MIPINKPLIVGGGKGNMEEVKSLLSSFFPNKKIYITFSGRQGLDRVYKNLYNEYGSLSVAVSPLACFDALYPIIKNKHKIHFVDINPQTLNMDENLVPENVQIIQPIHFGGNPQNMNEIISISKKNQQIVVEDCAQAFGSTFNSQMVGTFGDYSVFSLMKNVYALGGGFVLSNNELKNSQNKELGFAPTYYRIFKRILESKNTYNSRVTNFILYNCILSLRPKNVDIFYEENNVNKVIINSIYSQLLRFECLLEKRLSNAKYMLNNINNENITPQYVLPEAVSNYTRLYFVLKNCNSEAIIKKLRNAGIGANHITQDSINFYQNTVFENDSLSKYAEKEKLANYLDLHDHILSIPISPNLSKKEMDYVIEHLNTLII